MSVGWNVITSNVTIIEQMGAKLDKGMGWEQLTFSQDIDQLAFDQMT
jgi:hypothetical protein